MLNTKNAVQESELQSLLKKNITNEGLTPKEYSRAEGLIMTMEESEENCWVCETLKGKVKAVADTGLCRGHARYALITRK